VKINMFWAGKVNFDLLKFIYWIITFNEQERQQEGSAAETTGEAVGGEDESEFWGADFFKLVELPSELR
jgi:hypothetical protein